MRNILSSRPSYAALALLLITATAQSTASQGDGNTRTTISLIAVGSEQNSTGSATIEIHSGGASEQSFSVRVAKLTASATYQLMVDGNQIATFTVGNAGGAQVRFSTNPHGQEQSLPTYLIPVSNLHLVEIKNASTGEVVLAGAF